MWYGCWFFTIFANLYGTDGTRTIDEEFDRHTISLPLLGSENVKIRFRRNSLLLAIVISGFDNAYNVLREKDLNKPTSLAST